MSMLQRDPIFGALTRPQMFAGVTYSYFVINAVATMELFLVTKSLWTLPVAAVLHIAGSLACLREPRIFDLWLMRFGQCPPVRNRAFWRCNSYSA
jgi:type IV secretion system protein VirB3